MKFSDVEDGQYVSVTIEGKVERGYGGAIMVVREDNGNFLASFKNDGVHMAVVEIREPPLRVGPAKFREDGSRCEVIAIDEHWAWVKWRDGDRGNIPTHQLRNIEDGEGFTAPRVDDSPELSGFYDVADDDGWIEWTGEGEPPKGRVFIRMRDNDENVGPAHQFSWSHYDVGADIIAYKKC